MHYTNQYSKWDWKMNYDEILNFINKKTCNI